MLVYQVWLNHGEYDDHWEGPVSTIYLDKGKAEDECLRLMEFGVGDGVTGPYKYDPDCFSVREWDVVE